MKFFLMQLTLLPIYRLRLVSSDGFVFVKFPPSETALRCGAPLTDFQGFIFVPIVMLLIFVVQKPMSKLLCIGTVRCVRACLLA